MYQRKPSHWSPSFTNNRLLVITAVVFMRRSLADWIWKPAGATSPQWNYVSNVKCSW